MGHTSSGSVISVVGSTVSSIDVVLSVDCVVSAVSVELVLVVFDVVSSNIKWIHKEELLETKHIAILYLIKKTNFKKYQTYYIPLDKYQIVLVRNDFIPFSQDEVENLKDTYLKSKLLLEKSDESMETKDKPLISFNKFEFEKKIDVPKIISGDLRLPIALIGGGVVVALFVALCVIMGKDDE